MDLAFGRWVRRANGYREQTASPYLSCQGSTMAAGYVIAAGADGLKKG